MADAPERLTVAIEQPITPGDVSGTMHTTPDGVTTFIAEPTLGKSYGELPTYDLMETNLTADAFAQMERQFAPYSRYKTQSYEGYNNNLDPSLYSPISVWGGGYAGGNTTLLLSRGIQVIEPRINLQLVHSLLYSNPWHYACVDAKSKATTQLGYEIIPIRKMQRGVANEDLKRFNAFEERIYRKTGLMIPDIFEQISHDFFSTGNLNLEIVFQYGGDIDCIYPVSTTTCFKHCTLPLIIQRSMPPEFAFTTFGERITVMPRFMAEIEPSEYIQYVEPGDRGEIGYHAMVEERNIVISTDPYYGTADVLSVLPTLFGDNAADIYNLQFFRNNAVPRYAITIEGGRVTDEVTARIKRFLATEVKSEAHRSIVIPLNRGFKATFQKLDSQPNEASFLAYKEMNREAIASVHRVPPTEIGLWEDANRSNGEQQSKNFLLKVIKPHQVRLANIMNFIMKYGFDMHGVVFKWVELELTSEREIATIRQINAMARASEAVAIKQVIDSTTKAVEAQVIDAGSVQQTITTLLNRYRKLVEEADFYEI